MSENNYVLVESFAIDDGQLDGLSPQDCFVFGYELASISARAENDLGEWSLPIHADNAQRITTALEKRGRARIVTWLQDLSEGWMQLTVLPKCESK